MISRRSVSVAWFVTTAMTAMAAFLALIIDSKLTPIATGIGVFIGAVCSVAVILGPRDFGDRVQELRNGHSFQSHLFEAAHFGLIIAVGIAFAETWTEDNLFAMGATDTARMTTLLTFSLGAGSWLAWQIVVETIDFGGALDE